MIKGNLMSAGGLDNFYNHTAIFISNYSNEKYKNIEVYRNHLFDAPYLKRFMLVNGDNDGGYLKIFNNKVECLWGIDIVGGTVDQSIYIYNNTFSMTMRNGLYPTALLVQSEAAITAGNRIQFVNNIAAFTSAVNAKYLYYSPMVMNGQFYVDNNCYYNSTASTPFQYLGVNRTWTQWTTLLFDTNSYGPSVDPDLDANLDLNSTSDCINSGVYNSGGDAYWDYYGTLRSNYDIGCHEYVAP